MALVLGISKEASMARVLQARDVMTGRVATITGDAPVKEAARLMTERRVSALPVVDGAQRLVGIVSEGDLIRRTEIGTGLGGMPWARALVGSNARRYLKSRGARVRDVMSRRVVSVRSGAPLREVAELLERHRIKRVPVLERGRIAGIVSRADLVRALATAPTRPAARTPKDRHMRGEVLHAIGRSGAGGLNLNATVEHGVVHLWGDVRSRAEQALLRKSARAVAGVRKVEDHTAVMPLPVAGAAGVL